MKRRIGVLVLVLLLAVTAALVQSGGAALKPVKLHGYLLGSAPAGMPEVMAALNKKLQQDLNCTMEISYIGWGDFQSKYPLVLASGADVDWIYTANWSFYAQQAAKGAFLELTPAMLQKYMPRHYKATNPVAWKEALIDGKIYMVPTSTPDRKIGCTIIRGDLRQKYGVPPVKKFADLERYFEAIKKNEPGMLPMNLDGTYDIGRPFAALFIQAGVNWQDILYSTGGGSGIVFDYSDPKGRLYKITDEPVLSHYKQAAKIMQSWYAKDYFNKDVFANKVRSKDAFDQGKSAVGFGNTQDIQANLAHAKSVGWIVEVIPDLDANGHGPADPYINNGVAICARSKNPERALMALDLIMEDPAYDYLCYFGIEGKNYVIKDGKIDLPPGVTADKNTYPPDAAGFWFTNKDLFLPLASWDPQYIQLRESLKTWLIPNVYAALSPDTTPVKTEVANLNQIMVQYLNPIMLGMVSDIDKAFADLDARLKAAGIDRVLAEFRRQTQAFLAAQK